MPASFEMPNSHTKILPVVLSVLAVGAFNSQPATASALESDQLLREPNANQLLHLGKYVTFATHHHNHIKAIRVPKVLRAIRGCESGNGKPFSKPRYHIRNASDHTGAYQFDHSTWHYYHGYPTAADSPPKTQDRRAVQVLHQRGTEPWNASRSCWSAVVAPVAPRK